MNKGQKNILIMIGIFIIIIVALLVLLSSIKNQPINNNSIVSNNNVINITNSTTLENNEIEDPVYTIVEHKNQNTQMSIIKNIENRSVYFTIKNLTMNYVNYIGFNNKEVLEDIISQEYIEKYNIMDITKIINIPKAKSGQHYEVILTDVLTAQIQETQYVFIVTGKGRIAETNQTFDINIFIRLDEENSLYAIYPYNYLTDNGYNNLKSGDTINCKKEELKKNQNNKFTYIVKNDFDMAKEYFNNYNELLLYYPEDAYNKLDREYSKKRFNNIENFKQHIDENKKTIRDMEISSYTTIYKEEYVDYICADKYENIYVFRKESGSMKYTVFMDKHTVMLEEELREYNKLDKFDRAKYNLTKFVNMVNTKDYNAIYDVLDTTFRTNNFKTVEVLKEYIKSNLYDLNSIEIEDYDDETYKYYIFKCKITNMRNNNEGKDITVIINQEKGTNFTMSFSFE